MAQPVEFFNGLLDYLPAFGSAAFSRQAKTVDTALRPLLEDLQMPRLTAATPKYRHHKASGQAVATIAGRDCYLV